MSTHNLCFVSKIRKNCIPQFLYIKLGLKGVFNTWTCLHDDSMAVDRDPPRKRLNKLLERTSKTEIKLKGPGPRNGPFITFFAFIGELQPYKRESLMGPAVELTSNIRAQPQGRASIKECHRQMLRYNRDWKN